MTRKLSGTKIGLAILVFGFAGFGPGVPRAAADDAPRSFAGRTFDGGAGEEQRLEDAAPRRLDPAAPIGREMRLEPFVAEQRLEKTESEERPAVPLRIGAHRDLPPELEVEMGARDLEWEAARGGGQVAVFSLTSPGAKAIRVALDIERLPRGAELRFYSPASPLAEAGVFAASALTSSRKAGGAEPFWSPVVRGETLVVEIWVPVWRRGSEVRLSVRRVSHIYRSIDTKDLDGIGFSGSCNRDMACDPKWQMAGDSVAKIIFEAFGGTALCSGQLMNSVDGKPLFLTASHCVSSRASARSVAFFWFFQRAACNGPDPTTEVQTAGGGKRLFTTFKASKGLGTDHTLLLLKRDPPAGVSLMGWSAEDIEDHTNARVNGVHHPAGDLKKVSFGKTTRDTWRQEANGSLSAGVPRTHIEVVWKKGTTEGGSSGSFLAIGKTWPEQFAIGVLTRGAASCSNRKGPDFYGSFGETFENNRKFRKKFL